MSEVVQRYDVGHLDAGSLQSPQKMPNGWLRVEGYLTRTGIFTYRNPNGSERRELRLPEEVFKNDSLASFRLVPFTDDHPPGLLTSDNTTPYIKGAVGEGVRRDGEQVRAEILVMDGETIAKMQAGKTQLSCGYSCELDQTPGEWNGQRYDAIQRKITGNHVALVDRGRAGDACVRMDAATMVIGLDKETNSFVVDIDRGNSHMTKYRIDGVEFEVSEQASQALTKRDTDQAVASNKADEAFKSLVAERDIEKARADGLAEQLTKAEAARKEAEDPAKIVTAVKARVALEVVARTHLGVDANLDGMSERAVKLAVLDKLGCAKIAETESDVYINGRYDQAIEVAAKATPGLDAARRAAVGDPTAKGGLDVNKARRDHAVRMQNAWKTTVKGDE